MKGSFIDKSANLIDKAILLFYFAFIIINVVQEMLVRIGGGVINLMVHYFFWGYFVVLYGENNGNKVGKKSLVAFLLVYLGIIQFFWDGSTIYKSAFGPVKTYIFDFLSLIPLLFSALAILEKTDEKTIKLVRFAFVAFLGMVCVFSIYHLIKDPTAGRATANSDRRYYPFLMNYATAYGAAVIFPFILVWATKIKKKAGSILFAFIKFGFIGVLLLAVFKMSFFLSLIAIVLSVVCYLVFRIKRQKLRQGIIVGTIGFILLMFATGAAEAICFWLSKKITSFDISRRLLHIAQFLQTGEIGKRSTLKRLILYADAFIRFIKNPFTGNIILNPNTDISGHSTLLDTADGFGIFTTALLVVFLVNVLKFNLKHKGRNEKAASISSFIVLIFIMLVNPVFAAPAILVFYILGGAIFMGYASTGKKQLVLNRCLYEDS